MAFKPFQDAFSFCKCYFKIYPGNRNLYSQKESFRIKSQQLLNILIINLNILIFILTSLRINAIINPET